MPWFKVDDSFESHPKVKSIPRARRVKAIGLWTLAGSWAARQLTDGFVPDYMLDELAASRREAATLVEVGLWVVAEGGYAFKDWHDWQPTKAKVEAEREAAKERMRVARERKKGTSSGEVRANDSVSPSNRSGEVRSTPGLVTPTRPDPTRPVHKEEADASSLRAVALTEPDRFDEFWNTYGHKKDRVNAEKKWKLALKKPGVTADLLIACAADYVLYERTHNEGGRYIMGPAKWLLNERWTDERPARPAPQSNAQAWLQLATETADADRSNVSPFRQIGGGA
jgi:hypothetical protein